MGYRAVVRSRRFWVLVLLSLAAVGFFAWQQDFGGMGRAFAQAKPAYVGGAVGAYFLSLWVRAVRWRMLLSPLRDTGDWNAFHALAVGTMVNNLLPARMGLVARAHLLGRRARISRAAVGGSLFSEALFDGVVILALVGLALGVVRVGGTLQFLALVLAGGLCAFLFLALLIAYRNARLQRAVAPLLNRLPRAFAHALHTTGSHTADGLGTFRCPFRIGRVLGVSGLSWGLMGVAYLLLGAAFDLPLNYVDYLVIAGVANLAVTLPLLAGGVGAFELATFQILSALGVGQPDAGAYVVALHALLIVPIVVVGLLMLGAEGRRPRFPTLLPARLLAGRLVGLPRPLNP